MNKIVFLFLFAILSFRSNSQGVPLSKDIPENQAEMKKNDKFDYSMNTGTTFSYSKGYGNTSTFYLAPEFKWKLSSKLKINAGVMLGQNRFNYGQSLTTPVKSVVERTPTQSYSGLLYVTGNYAFGSRLSLTGSVEKGNNVPGSSIYQQNMLSNYQSCRLGSITSCRPHPQ